MTTLRRILQLTATEGDIPTSEPKLDGGTVKTEVGEVLGKAKRPETPENKETEKEQPHKAGKRKRQNQRDSFGRESSTGNAEPSKKKKLAANSIEAGGNGGKTTRTIEKSFDGAVKKASQLNGNAVKSKEAGAKEELSGNKSMKALVVTDTKHPPSSTKSATEQPQKLPTANQNAKKNKAPVTTKQAAVVERGSLSQVPAALATAKKPTITPNDLLVLKPRPPPRNASKRCPGRNEGDKKDKTVINGTVPIKNTDAGSIVSSSVVGNSSVTSSSTKKKSSNTATNSEPVPDASTTANTDKQAEESNWVMCDRCEKWRTIPGFVDVKKLSRVEWYCEMNEWDPKQAQCSAPDTYDTQNTSQQRQRQRKKQKGGAASLSGTEGKQSGKASRAGGKSKGGKSSASVASGDGPKTSQIVPNLNGRQTGGASASNTRNRMNGTSASVSSPSKGGTWQWVMCETCQQWRKLPPHVDVSRLPEKWYCSMNKWDPLRARCSAAQEHDEQKLLARHQEEQAAMRNQVRLPPGVNLYGNWGMSSGRKLVAPNNYRELIVNHYRHFRNWDQVASATCNARYAGTSLFTPKGQNRRNKKAKQLGTPSTIYNLLFRDSVAKKGRAKTDGNLRPTGGGEGDMQENGDGVGSSLEARCCPTGIDGNGSGVGLLRLTKPWKRLGGWVAGDTFCCKRNSDPCVSANSNVDAKHNVDA